MKNTNTKINLWSALFIASFFITSIIFLNSYTVPNDNKLIENETQVDTPKAIETPKSNFLANTYLYYYF